MLGLRRGVSVTRDAVGSWVPPSAARPSPPATRSSGARFFSAADWHARGPGSTTLLIRVQRDQDRAWVSRTRFFACHGYLSPSVSSHTLVRFLGAGAMGPRVLMLHGLFRNAHVFERKMRKIIEAVGDDAEFVWVDSVSLLAAYHLP